MRLTVKPQDVLRSKVVDPGWYRAKITKLQDKPAIKDGSNNSEVNFEIVSNADGSSTPFVRVPITHWFNEKFPGFAIEFIEAMGGKVSETANADFDIGQALVGKFIDINVANEPYQQRVLNKISNFRAAQVVAVAGAVPAA